MEFAEALKPWSAAKIAETVGCSERNAYFWKAGERKPEPWAQKLILDRLKRVKPDASE
jgi:hypothetical protein